MLLTALKSRNISLKDIKSVKVDNTSKTSPSNSFCLLLNHLITIKRNFLVIIIFTYTLYNYKIVALTLNVLKMCGY